MSDLSLKAIEIATTQLHEDEKPHGSNWGEPVKTYLASVGIDFPASWCLAFVYWCFLKAADALHTITPLVKTGGVLRAWNEAASHHAATPEPGDIVIFDHGHGLGHTGIVVEVIGSDFKTIEGNTNNDGSREGYEVEYKKRNMNDKSLKGFLRY